MEDRLRDGRGRSLTPVHTDRKSFIKAETAILPVPNAPEIRLHLADEAMALWEKTEEELGALGLPPPFWAFAWAGGQALARYILDNPDIVAGKRVFDFAAGSGLVGIAAAKAGAAKVTASEIDDYAIAAIELNGELNGIRLETTFADVTQGDIPEADVMFCGDVFYEKPMAERVVAFLDRLLKRGVPVYIGDPGRSYLPKERLVGLATYEIEVIRSLEDAEIKKTSVFKFVS
ncbi:methyltransferase [Rhizobiales bacterium]|uniref:class I SAM-dependent methyltransferase n=1 Tax=Hongsoonwoonella zoysiae TaxID=2821844 RepID=UPI00155F7371|nr:methyltransferase [Hongsoonwoonella zoysiae]NRG16884.1 methyltransferase [Hongsoonwoonella zoysiae]